MSDRVEPLSTGRITRFWAPLAATWMMMAIEGPVIAAIIARLLDPEHNLAAHGVAFAVAVIVEAPVIMLTSAAVNLARDRDSFLDLRRHALVMSFSLSALLALIVASPGYDRLAYGVLDLPPAVAELAHASLFWLIPWPAAIGYRRFYQGVLIRAGATRRVAAGTVWRLVGMGGAGLGVALLTEAPGAVVGGVALSSGVIAEALACRHMARHARRELILTAPAPNAVPLTLRRFVDFYTPLAMTSFLAMAAHPVSTFFLARGRFPIESLAVVPVINSLVFLFRALGLAFQEVAVALVGDRLEHLPELGRFAGRLALAAAAGLSLIAFTPLGTLWLVHVAGLTPALAAHAVLPLRILAVLPALSVLLSSQRALLVVGWRTGAVTTATLVELAGLAVVLALGIEVFDLPGAVAAALAFLLGRVGGNLWLIPPCRAVIAAGGRR